LSCTIKRSSRTSHVSILEVVPCAPIA
jgi:hypothetical protein